MAAQSIGDDDLRRLCDAERAMLDDAMAAERAMLDALADELTLLDAIGGIVKPGSITRAARRMTVKRCTAVTSLLTARLYQRPGSG